MAKEEKQLGMGSKTRNSNNLRGLIDDDTRSEAMLQPCLIHELWVKNKCKFCAR